MKQLCIFTIRSLSSKINKNQIIQKGLYSSLQDKSCQIKKVKQYNSYGKDLKKIQTTNKYKINENQKYKIGCRN